MGASAFQRLLRVLELEEKQGWRNRAVIGGLLEMAARWQQDALGEQVDPAVVTAVVRLMGQYQSAAGEARPALAGSIRRTLTGEEPVATAEVSPAGEAKGPTQDDPEWVEPSEAEQIAASVAMSVPPPEPTHVARERVRRQQATRGRSAADLEAPVETLAGVGRTTAEQLGRLGIVRIVDLLWHLPLRYEDYSRLRTIAQLTPGEQVTVIANLWEIRERKISMKRAVVEGILADSTGTLRATWWNKYVRNQLRTGTTMRFSGKVGLFLGQKTLDNPAFEDLDEEMVATGRISPVYPLTEGLGNKKLRGLVSTALEEYGQWVIDPLPEEVQERYGLSDLATALPQAHFPDDQTQLEAALRRLAFDELLALQLGVMQRRRDLRQATAQALPASPELREALSAALPFALTGAQGRALDEVLADLARTVPMTRLLQGDVGSGKTVVAAAGMYAAAANGAQSVLLAPTQILAEQHYRSLTKILGGLTRADGQPLAIALLTGRVTGQERDLVREGLATGQIDVVVGTTAVIQETVEFANVGLVVVDEQHRFGVEQRGALRSKGMQPHMLVMSATPIPRSLAMTIYGDLDVSVIDEMPPGREPVKTKWFRPAERERLYNFMRKEAREGRQAFIVYPLVEESEKVEAGAATSEHERLDKEILPELRLALLHGRMKGQEKDEVMTAFAAGEYDVLVSTTVIEVGIDVPNATLILVEDAERFGLAQLHQLRGRVGRGGYKSYCALISAAEGPEAAERLRVLESTNSGFELAEKDLELRGPGDFLGTRQSGLPALRVAQLSDMKTLVAAREAAAALIEQDATLENHPLLAERVRLLWSGEGDVS